MFNSISDERAQRTPEISSGTREEKFHATMYYFVYSINILITKFLTIFRRIPTIFLKKIFQMLSEGHWNVSEHFPKFPEDFRSFTEDFRG